MALMLEGAGDLVRVRISGELTADTCQNLMRAITESLSRDPRKIALDLKDVPFLDTSGLGMLVAVQKITKDAGVRMVLMNPSEPVRDLLKMTRLTEVFAIKEDA